MDNLCSAWQIMLLSLSDSPPGCKHLPSLSQLEGVQMNSEKQKRTFVQYGRIGKEGIQCCPKVCLQTNRLLMLAKQCGQGLVPPHMIFNRSLSSKVTSLKPLLLPD